MLKEVRMNVHTNCWCDGFGILILFFNFFPSSPLCQLFQKCYPFWQWVLQNPSVILLWFKNTLKTPNVRDLCARGMLNANEVNDWPAWCSGRSTPCQECCASVFKESLSSLKSFSLGTLFNSFIYRCTSNSEWICCFALGSVSLNETMKGKWVL